MEKRRIVASVTLQFFLNFPAFKHKANFGITVHDDYQNKGLGTSLTRHMLEIAKRMGLRKVSLVWRLKIGKHFTFTKN